MSVSGYKNVQSLAIHQKTKQKENLKMGKVLFQSMTRSQDHIDITNTMKEIEAPSKILAIIPGPAPPPLPQLTTDMAIRAQNASTPVAPITNKENISAN